MYYTLSHTKHAMALAAHQHLASSLSSAFSRTQEEECRAAGRGRLFVAGKSIAALSHTRKSVRLAARPQRKTRVAASSVSRAHRTRAAVSTTSDATATSAAALRPLRVMISGAPASGKGTQCELIVEKYGLTHISAGDLLRLEVSHNTADGLVAKKFMDAGKLVPDEVVVTIVKNRLAQEDARTNGWLLDGYPRSLSQAQALLALDIAPDVFILLDVPDSILVDRVVGRRLDPATNRIYHLIFAPPETDEVAGRLVQRSDDTEEKVKARLQTHTANVASVLGVYQDKLVTVNGNRPKVEIFSDIDGILERVQSEAAKSD